MDAMTERRIRFPELRAALQQVLGPVPVTRLRRRMSPYSSSYVIEDLSVGLADGTRLSLVLKDLSPGSVLPTARKVRPEFLYQSDNEIRTYRHILASRPLGTARFHGAVEDVPGRRHWLFLERVTGPLLWQVAGGEPWNAAARWLARLHQAFPAAESPTESPGWSHLRRLDKAFFEVWPGRAETLVRRQGLGADAAERARFRHLLDQYPRVVDRLGGLPRSFIHGEFYPSNILLQTDAEPMRVCPVDWELAALGPSLLDLAALTSGDWSDADRDGMIVAYRDGLASGGGPIPSLPELTEGVEHCRLHLAVQLLGWSADWEAPPQHARDWFSEALRVAVRLGILPP